MSDIFISKFGRAVQWLLVAALALFCWATARGQTEAVRFIVPASGGSIANIVTNSPARTNMLSGLVKWLNETCTTNYVATNAAAMSNWWAALQASTGVIQTNNYTDIVYSNPAAFYPMAGNPSNFITGDSFASTNWLSQVGVPVYPVSNGTNFWIDLGLTNGMGGLATMRTVTATNTVWFMGVTNGITWRQASFNVYASGADRKVFIPDFAQLDTNGLTASGSHWSVWVTNGNELRLSVQTNVAGYSVLWLIPRQAVGLWESDGWAQQPTNSSADGDTVFATGAASKWGAPPWLLAPTNSGADAQVPIRSGTNSYWGAVPMSAGTNSTVQSLYPANVLDLATSLALDFRNGDNCRAVVYDNSASCEVSVSDYGWIAPAGQIERHEVLLVSGGEYLNAATVALTWKNAVWANGNGSTNGPAGITTNQMIRVWIEHVGGHTNWVGSWTTVTNPLAFKF